MFGLPRVNSLMSTQLSVTMIATHCPTASFQVVGTAQWKSNISNLFKVFDLLLAQSIPAYVANRWLSTVGRTIKTQRQRITENADLLASARPPTTNRGALCDLFFFFLFYRSPHPLVCCLPSRTHKQSTLRESVVVVVCIIIKSPHISWFIRSKFVVLTFPGRKNK